VLAHPPTGCLCSRAHVALPKCTIHARFALCSSISLATRPQAAKCPGQSSSPSRVINASRAYQTQRVTRTRGSSAAGGHQKKRDPSSKQHTGQDLGITQHGTWRPPKGEPVKTQPPSRRTFTRHKAQVTQAVKPESDVNSHSCSSNSFFGVNAWGTHTHTLFSRYFHLNGPVLR
jgi:hypothetical protein